MGIPEKACVRSPILMSLTVSSVSECRQGRAYVGVAHKTKLCQRLHCKSCILKVGFSDPTRRLTLNRRRLEFNQWKLAFDWQQLMVNLRQLADDQPQFFANWRSAEFPVYRRPAGFCFFQS